MFEKPYKFNKQARRQVIDYVRDHGYNIGAMASAAGVCTVTVYRHMNTDEEFRKGVERAQGQFLRVLEDEAKRRAVEGWIQEKQRDSEGNVVKEVRKFSDALLLHLLKANGPTKHRDSLHIESTVTGKVAHEHSGQVDIASLPPDKQRAVRVLLAREEPSEN